MYRVFADRNRAHEEIKAVTHRDCRPRSYAQDVVGWQDYIEDRRVETQFRLADPEALQIIDRHSIDLGVEVCRSIQELMIASSQVLAILEWPERGWLHIRALVVDDREQECPTSG